MLIITHSCPCLPRPPLILAALAKYVITSTPELDMRSCSSLITFKSTSCDESLEFSISRRMVFKYDKDEGKELKIAMAIRPSLNPRPTFESMRAAPLPRGLLGFAVPTALNPTGWSGTAFGREKPSGDSDAPLRVVGSSLRLFPSTPERWSHLARISMARL